MGIYDTKIASTAAQIKRKGQLVQWRQFVDGTPADADKPWLVGDTSELNFEANILFLPYSKDAPNEQKSLLTYAAGSNLVEGRLYGLMPATNFEPSPKDVVDRAGKILNIASIDTLAPNGQVILYVIGFTA